MKTLLKIATLSLLILISGCSTLSPSFITVVQDHRVVTAETNAALIDTFREECAESTDPDILQACEDMIERLIVVSRQAVAIEKFVLNKATEEDLALWIRSKWRADP